MGAVNVKKVVVDGDMLYFRSKFRNIAISKGCITSFKIGRVASLFEEIGITINCEKEFIVTERAAGFFDLARALDVEKYFGPLWYRDAENGLTLKRDLLK
jgi:hypothetical protein